MVPNQELQTSDFVGVWQRTAIYEPKGTLGPDSDQRKMVLWVQTRSGLFIDIRYDPGLSYDPHLLKSFGGDVSFDQKSAHFTWHRAIDYRILGTPDVGLMNFTAPDTLEEDGVLPGDDYREIWQRLERGSDADFACRVTVNDDRHNVSQQGYFLGVGEYFAFAINRPRAAEDHFATYINSLFTQSGELLDAPGADLLEHLQQYVAVIGLRKDWRVVHSLDPSMIGQCIDAINCEHSQLRSLLAGASWEAVEGDVPEGLREWIAN